MNQNYWIFVGMGLLLIVAELFLGVSVGFDLVIVGCSLLIGGLVTWFTGDTLYGIIATGLASALYFFFLRMKIQKSLMGGPTQKLNVDKLIGQEGVVTTDISPSAPGQVKVEGEVWRAVSNENLSVNTTIIIDKVEGVTLQVRKSN